MRIVLEMLHKRQKRVAAYARQGMFGVSISALGLGLGSELLGAGVLGACMYVGRRGWKVSVCVRRVCTVVGGRGRGSFSQPQPGDVG